MALPQTLKAGATVAARRITSGAVANLPPALATDGYYNGRRYCNVWAQCVGGTSFDVGIWQYSSVSGQWVLRTDVGTVGYQTVTPTTPFEAMLDCAVAERIAIEIKTLVGPPTDCNTWAEGYNPND